MANRGTTPLVLNNGVYLQTTEYDHHSHLDQSHVKHLSRGKEKITDLGIVQPFVTAGYLMKPYLYSFSNMGQNRVYVDGHIFKWGHPTHDEPCYIMEDISGRDKPGIAGEKFKIKVNKRKYDHGYIIAVDQHDPHHLLITPDEIIEDGDGVILTVKLKSVDQANRWFPKEYLRPGTKFFPITTVETEYSETYSSIPTFSGGMREYFNTVGYTSAQLHYSVTRDAAFSKISKETVAGLDKYREIVEMYVFRPGSTGYDLSLQGHGPQMLKAGYQKKYGSKYKDAMKYDIVKRMWVPKIEALGMAWLEAMVEQEAIWGSGGLIDYDGKTKAQSSLGLFHQLNMGNQHIYNLFNFTLEKFEFILASRIKDRIEPFKGNKIVIKTGQGGLALIKNMLRRQPSKAGMVLQGNDYITGIGKNNNQGLGWTNPEFNNWEMANGYGNVSFELAPGLDPIDANPQVNPIVPMSKGIGGHRLSSYMFIIDDITNADSGNIVELVYGPDWDYRHSVIQGKMAYMGNTFGNSGSWQRSNHHPGFEVFMEKRHKAYFVKDITKSLLIKPINPFNGRPIYDPTFGKNNTSLARA